MNKNLKAKKKKIIGRLKNTFCTLKISKIHGIGVFAIRNIPKYINPFAGEQNQNWYELTRADYRKLDREIIKMMGDFFVIEKNGNILVPEFGLNSMNVSNRLNHSSKPNIKRKSNGDFITLRNIKKGEELLVDYGTFDWKFKNKVFIN
ncbi:MAG: SET domain-containing protein [Candidatus Falkowbacteria bacterium]|nr:SET domain-containing protein [Candidatus Falkowbacteria bacterium]